MNRQIRVFSYLDVLCVGGLQLLSEVWIRLQDLDHLSEIPVVVQARVLVVQTHGPYQNDSRRKIDTH